MYSQHSSTDGRKGWSLARIEFCAEEVIIFRIPEVDDQEVEVGTPVPSTALWCCGDGPPPKPFPTLRYRTLSRLPPQHRQDASVSFDSTNIRLQANMIQASLGQEVLECLQPGQHRQGPPR